MKQKKKYIIISIAILIILFIIGSFYYIYFNDRENMDNTIIDDTKLIEEVFSDKNISHNKEIIEGYRNTYNNQDVVGEIEFLNTDYKKPLMQYSDNDYYLNHTEDKTSSYMGSIYLDFRTDINNGDKLLIYGHNSASIDMPFKILESYYDYNYYLGHKYVKITSEEKTRLYKIYAITIEVEDFNYMQTDFNNEEEWYQHIHSFKDKSMYDTGEDVTKDDKILIMQTCSTHYKYKNYDRKFLIVVAKEVSEK